MAKILAIIMTMLGIVIGANLVAPINTATNTAVVSVAGIGASLAGLALLIPLLFVVVVMIFAVKGIEA